MKKVATAVMWSVVLTGLLACSDTSTNDATIYPEAANSASMQFAPPAAIFANRAVNFGNLAVDIRVNNTVISGERQGSSEFWSAQASVGAGEQVLLAVTWYENFLGDTRLDLAHWERSMVVNASMNVQIPEGEYITTDEGLSPDSFIADGLRMDFDQDGFSNIAERRANSNPLNSVSTPAVIPVVDVIVPVSTVRSPSVDGEYSALDYETQNAAFRDTNGNRLYIDNLMEDAGTASVLPSRSDGNAEMRWFTIHDNTHLYIAVLGEDVGVSTPIRDSERVWQDDNLNIFLDTDNSAGSVYDNVNDFHIMIPLLSESGLRNFSGSPEDGGTVVLAQLSAPLDIDNIQFATCGTCGTSGQHFWEVRIPLSILGLQSGSVFGIDVQLDIDHDGNNRDSKWGWAHPSGSDTTWMDPSRMAKGYLQ